MGRAHPIVGKTPVQTVHADFPHTAYQVVVQVVALCGPRILNGPAQAVESQGLEEGTTPRIHASGAKTAPGSLDEQGVQPVFDVTVDVDEFGRRVARAEILSPPTEHRMEGRDDATEVLMTPRARGQCPHAQTHPLHRA